MSDKEYVKSLIKEAEVYRSQGLLVQAKETYSKVLAFVKKSNSLAGRNDLITAVGKKIKEIDQGLEEVQEAPDIPELSENEHRMIKDLFAFSGDKKTAAMEGALALAKIIHVRTSGQGRQTRYFFRVLDNLPLLPPRQVEYLTPALQERHKSWILQCSIDYEDWQQLSFENLIEPEE